MINIPSTPPAGGSVTPVRKATVRRVAQSNATVKREYNAMDRRRKNDRRQRRGAKQVMDRRSGVERRRSSIDLSV